MIKGSIVGVPQSTSTEKLWKVSQALDTLKSPPPENTTMKKASMIAIFITTFFYLCFGYAVFGNKTPGNILAGFGFYEQYWLIDFANACIFLHLVGGYQMFNQPVFGFVEKWIAQKYPNSSFANNPYGVQSHTYHHPKSTALGNASEERMCINHRHCNALPFNQVLGVLGASNFWPLAIYFPVEMYFVQRKIGTWTLKWVVLQAFSLVCLLMSAVALVGSVEGLISEKLS